MSGKRYLYHYYSDPLNPFRSYMDEGFSTPQEYADYAAHVDGVRMVGYHARYFQKRAERESLFRGIAMEKCPHVTRTHPIYTTLGEENRFFFRIRRHRFSLALPLECEKEASILFFIGDSMGAEPERLRERTFSYEEFLSLSEQQIQALMPANPKDRYVEVQLWGDELTDGFLPPRHTPGYCEALARAVLRTNFPAIEISDSPSLSSAVAQFREEGSFSSFCRLLYSGNPAFLPKGFIHGVAHSVRCAFLAFCLARAQGLSVETALWAAKCAAYHDSGRVFTAVQAEHAAMAAHAAKALFPAEEADDALRVMLCHCKGKRALAASFGSDEKEKQLFLIAQAVHDADSLDYIRLSAEQGIHRFQTRHLCLPGSKNYVCLAFELFLRSLDSKTWIQDIFQ